MNIQDRTPDSRLAGAFGATLILDLDTDEILAATPQAHALLKDPSLVGSRFSNLVADDVPHMILFVDEVIYRGEAWTRRIILRTRENDRINCEINGRSDGKTLTLKITDLAALERRAEAVQAASMYNGGILEWQRAQAFFSELERQNQLILNAAGEGIYGVNADGKTTFVNRAAQEMLGWTDEDLLGEDIHTKIHHHHLDGEVYPSHECPIYQSFRYEQVNRIEDEVFWRKDGKPIRVEYVSTPIYEGQRLAGAVVIFRDITERWENERKLREAMDQVAALRDRLEQENAYLQEAISIERAHHDVVGQSPAIQQILQRVEMVSRTQANVLITGESGTGKAMVASAIHNDSDRRRRPLIHFKCGSVTPDMFESELFGHVRGAFTGALRDKPGKLELAHGGTLFLDEVADIPLEQQGQLLDALQNRRVTRLGDDRARSLELRVVASTSRNLDREVQAGRMRPELVFFLNVFPIHCTPLRERPDDIPLLAAHFLNLVCKRLSRTPPIITEGTIRTLQQYDWPGNVRELANVIERGAIVSQGEKLVVDIHPDAAPATRKITTLLSEADIEQIRVANTIACLQETNGRVSGPNGAAALLGVKPTTLYSRIKTLGLSPDDWA
ncbi:PAS domain S-box-containing protein [Loktanella sp. PT4BL]|jgi:PAS domain S-box-containing protein|uniref:sigma-54 interaction domain-containing protein n=1 Tax=Loktanella sp. PT4BL TaxID=2135611 RepID=UPI000D75A432|nr:sigma 54-interacting transcriptional regulator [Loktanella sp. PT4BL]PXW72828.1 PAS domain S-box-containing protein [Loktanella sp. PT4BL]